MPTLRTHVQALRDITEAKKMSAAVEITIAAAFRDYTTDPAAPVQTRNLLPQTVAWIRLTPPDAKASKKEVAAVVDYVQKQWLAGLGKGYKGAFTPADGARGTSGQGASSGGATKPQAVQPDAYQTAEITVTKISSAGHRDVLARHAWSRAAPDAWK